MDAAGAEADLPKRGLCHCTTASYYAFYSVASYLRIEFEAESQICWCIGKEQRALRHHSISP